MFKLYDKDADSSIEVRDAGDGELVISMGNYERSETISFIFIRAEIDT